MPSLSSQPRQAAATPLSAPARMWTLEHAKGTASPEISWTIREATPSEEHKRYTAGRRGTLHDVPGGTVKAEIVGSKPVGRAGR
jgi:hypothetical protein